MSRLTVKTLEELADVLGVHRRTLATYVTEGCPAIKAKSGGYLVAPTASWYGRMMQRRQVAAFLKQSGEFLGTELVESLETLLRDHQKAWPAFLEREYSR